METNEPFCSFVMNPIIQFKIQSLFSDNSRKVTDNEIFNFLHYSILTSPDQWPFGLTPGDPCHNVSVYQRLRGRKPTVDEYILMFERTIF
jgi:hypothetical protein